MAVKPRKMRAKSTAVRAKAISKLAPAKKIAKTYLAKSAAKSPAKAATKSVAKVTAKDVAKMSLAKSFIE